MQKSRSKVAITHERFVIFLKTDIRDIFDTNEAKRLDKLSWMWVVRKLQKNVYKRAFFDKLAVFYSNCSHRNHDN